MPKFVHPFEIFRTNSEDVLAWRAVLEQPITQKVLSLLRENGPEFVQSPYGLTEIDIARRYGDCGGYARFYQLLSDMAAMWPLSPSEPDATYEPPEQEEE